eukprot:Nk52_evm10s263 gene=Nk52_evmTU10s263
MQCETGCAKCTQDNTCVQCKDGLHAWPRDIEKCHPCPNGNIKVEIDGSQVCREKSRDPNNCAAGCAKCVHAGEGQNHQYLCAECEIPKYNKLKDNKCISIIDGVPNCLLSSADKTEEEVQNSYPPFQGYPPCRMCEPGYQLYDSTSYDKDEKQHYSLSRCVKQLPKGTCLPDHTYVVFLKTGTYEACFQENDMSKFIDKCHFDPKVPDYCRQCYESEELVEWDDSGSKDLLRSILYHFTGYEFNYAFYQVSTHGDSLHLTYYDCANCKVLN